jgi:hypothetical protein
MMGKKRKVKRPKKHAGGRPTKYKPDYARQAALLCEYGATDKDLATFFRVNRDTINQWQKDYPEFSDTLKRAKTDFDQKVERALYERALGYQHPDTDIRLAYEDGEPTIIKTALVKHYPPDPTSCIFWLKNRQPTRWRDKVEVKHEGVIRANPELVAAAREVAAAALK